MYGVTKTGFVFTVLAVFCVGVAESKTIDPGINWSLEFEPKKFQKVEEYVFPKYGKIRELWRSGIRTNSLLVIKNGKLVYEKYARGFDKHNLHIAWSVSKSITSALIGIAEKKGLLSRHDPISKFYPHFNKGKKKELTIHHFLTHSSGLDWQETYEYDPLGSSVIQMLYLSGANDMVKFVLDRPFEELPGEKFEYSSGSSNLLMGVLKKAVGDENYDRFPWNELFNKIGMDRTVIEKDPQGVFIGASAAYVTPRDLARFGYLYINNGRWNGEQILPEDWVKYSTEIPQAFFKKHKEWKENWLVPGRHWWLNKAVPAHGIKKAIPEAPDDFYAALGHWGQAIYIIPSMDLVIVRTADDREKDYKRNELMRLLIKALKT